MSVAFTEPVLLRLKTGAGVVAFGRFVEQSSRNNSILLAHPPICPTCFRRWEQHECELILNERKEGLWSYSSDCISTQWYLVRELLPMSHVDRQIFQNGVWIRMLMEIWHLRLKLQSLLNGVSPSYRILFWNSLDQKSICRLFIRPQSLGRTYCFGSPLDTAEDVDMPFLCNYLAATTSWFLWRKYPTNKISMHQLILITYPSSRWLEYQMCKIQWVRYATIRGIKTRPYASVRNPKR